MKTYHIPCVWQMYGTIDIEAENIVEAIDIVNNPYTGLPRGSYLEDSFEIDWEVMIDDELTDDELECLDTIKSEFYRNKN